MTDAQAAGSGPGTDLGYVALVMATGIISRATQLDGAIAVSCILLVAGVASVLLAVADA